MSPSRQTDPWREVVRNLPGLQVKRASHYLCRSPLFGARHCHLDSFQISYVVRGKAEVEIEGRRFRFGPRDMAFIRPRQFHASFHDADTDFELIEIVFSAASRRCQRAIPALPMAIRLHNPSSVLPCLERVVAAQLLNLTPADEWLSRLCLCETLLALAKEVRGLSGTQPAAGDVEHRVRQAVDHIAGHYAEPLGVDSLAEAVGLSASYFAAAFRRIMCVSPVQFVIQRRLHHAKELLATSRLSVGQVAAMCGFASSQYFSRLFARKIGATPTQFRAQA